MSKELVSWIESQFPDDAPGEDFQYDFSVAVVLDIRDWRTILRALSAPSEGDAETLAMPIFDANRALFTPAMTEAAMDQAANCIRGLLEQRRRSAPSEAAAVPSGWKVVPVEPTEAMLDAAQLPSKPRDVWRAMLYAAPAE